MEKSVDVGILMGLTLKSVVLNSQSDVLIFTSVDNRVFKMCHEQSCCETVTLEDVIGDLDDLVGTEILQAEESTNSDLLPDGNFIPESWTWTFYRFATMKGSVVLRWYGYSNGYYSESVDLYEDIK